MNLLFTIVVTFFAGMGAGLGTGFAGGGAGGVVSIMSVTGGAPGVGLDG